MKPNFPTMTAVAAVSVMWAATIPLSAEAASSSFCDASEPTCIAVQLKNSDLSSSDVTHTYIKEWCDPRSSQYTRSETLTGRIQPGANENLGLSITCEYSFVSDNDNKVAIKFLSSPDLSTSLRSIVYDSSSEVLEISLEY